MIKEMVEFIDTLVKKGAAYESNGDVYFDITKAKDYGKLSKKNIEELMSGARIDVSEHKKHPGDFALWKAKKEGEPYWDSPWSQGRPGWHIECSVMAKTLLGDTIDIHSGGEDLQFPHHENEIAQSETCNGVPFARFWLHNGMITVENEKMSKSKGNFFTIREVSKEFDLEVLRYFLLTANYRNPINFSRDIMDQCKNALQRIYNAKEELENLMKDAKEGIESKNLKEKLEEERKFFEASMEDDINTADALTAIFNIVKIINTDLNENSSKEDLLLAQNYLMKLTKVLGILEMEKEDIDSEVENLIKEREDARKNKDFAKADQIRDKLKEMGIEIKDSRNGTKWTRI